MLAAVVITSLAMAAKPITLVGNHFSVQWDGIHDAQLAQVSGTDILGQFELLPASPTTFGQIRITDGQHVWISGGEAPSENLHIGAEGDIRTLTFSSRLRAEDNSIGPWIFDQTFYVYPEGAVFCDFTLTLAQDSEPITITDCTLSFPIQSNSFSKFRWFWKHDWRGDLYLDREKAHHEDGYLRVMGASIARANSDRANSVRPQIGYTNHFEICLEKKSAFGDADVTTMATDATTETDGVKTFSWTLYHGEPFTISPGYSYNNRWGLALTGARTNDDAIGQRICHWQEGNSGLMTYPSDSAVQAMADCGVSVCVLHLYWKTPAWGRDFTAYDEAEMARWVDACHKNGIKCILYTVPIDKPGINGINHEGYDRYKCDGLYFDFASTHFRATREGADMAYYAGREFPAMDFVNLTRHYRDVVGDRGIMIAHAGGAAPDAFYCLNMNAYLPGEAGEQGSLVGADLDPVYYHSGLQYAACHPWCEYEHFQNPEAVANFAAIGAFPHVLFGRGTHQDNNYHRSIYVPARFALPYWQMLRCIPMDRDTTMYNELTGEAATCNLPNSHCVVYRRAADQMLVIVSNLGDSGNGQITLDKKLLQPAGDLNLYRISGTDIARMRIKDLGTWNGATMATGFLKHRQYAAFLLAGPAKKAEAKKTLADIRKLVAMFNDDVAPGPVSDLTAIPVASGMRISWQPATDNSHIIEYRLYRTGPDGTRTHVANVEETTTYNDYTAPPAADILYEVTAIDVAENEGPAQSVKTASPAPDVIAISAPDTNLMQPFKSRWEIGNSWYSRALIRQPAQPEGISHKTGPLKARFVRAYFTGGLGTAGCAHVIEMQARDANGNAIAPVATMSSGDDPGHPATDIMDGITDQTRNGWWSDRTQRFPVWVGLDFGVSKSLNEVWLQTYSDGARYYDYAIEISEDAQEWRAVTATELDEPLARSFCDVDFSDGEIGVTTFDTPPSRTGGGILFRCPDDNNGYALYLDDNWDGAFCVGKLIDGKLQKMKAFFFPYTNHHPIPHRLRVITEGTHITCFCDEVKVFDFEDDTFSKGKVGVFTYTAQTLHLNNLTISTAQTP